MVNLKPIMKGRTGVGLAIILAWLVIALSAPILTPYNPNEINLRESLAPPSSAHLLGTDNFGRDTFTRVVYGAGVTFQVIVLSVVVITVPAGFALGLFSYFSRWLDSILNLITDVMLSLPGILFALVIVAGIGPGTLNVSIAVGISQIPYVARVTRSSIISLKSIEYVEAAVATGERPFSILTKYILANSYQPIVVQAVLRASSAVIAVAALSFIGLGVQIPEAEWGAMMVSGAAYLAVSPELVAYPGIALISLVMGMNIFGDGLQYTFREMMRK